MLIKIINARSVYFKQLQELSDDVVIPHIDNLILHLQKLQRQQKEKTLLIENIRQRLSYLKQLELSPNEIQHCPICQEELPNNHVITPCGHCSSNVYLVFCSQCLDAWIAFHSTWSFPFDI